jgi:hypothetical protein
VFLKAEHCEKLDDDDLSDTGLIAVCSSTCGT